MKRIEYRWALTSRAVRLIFDQVWAVSQTLSSQAPGVYIPHHARISRLVSSGITTQKCSLTLLTVSPFHPLAGTSDSLRFTSPVAIFGSPISSLYLLPDAASCWLCACPRLHSSSCSSPILVREVYYLAIHLSLGKKTYRLTACPSTFYTSPSTIFRRCVCKWMIWLSRYRLYVQWFRDTWRARVVISWSIAYPI